MANTVLPRIRIEDVPAIDRELLARTFVKGIKRYYSDPANVRDFEERQKQRIAQNQNLKLEESQCLKSN